MEGSCGGAPGGGGELVEGGGLVEPLELWRFPRPGAS